MTESVSKVDEFQALQNHQSIILFPSTGLASPRLDKKCSQYRQRRMGGS